MGIYELTYILSPEAISEETGAKAKEIELAIKNKGGIILKQSNPAAKMLSYSVKKHPSGFLGVLEFQLEPEKLAEFKQEIEKDEEILRHIFMKKKTERLKKQRRTKAKSISAFEEKKSEITQPEKQEEPSFAKSEGKGKVELKDIEQELEEILKE